MMGRATTGMEAGMTGEKKKVIEKYRLHEKDTGSVEVQVSLLTHRVNGLKEHFAEHRKDFHSRRGLIQMVEKRKKLLKYLKRKDELRYKELIRSLGLRK